MPPQTLVPIEDAHFLWMLGKGPAPDASLALPPGGVDEPETLRIVRDLTRRLHASDSRASWMIVAGGEVVGLCSYKLPPKDGVIEIGYGVAASRRNRGHARRAVAAVLEYARKDPLVSRVTAATTIANIASQRALARSGFEPTGTHDDPDDGKLVFWSHDLS